MKKYIKYALVFLILGVACGIFYREFSKAYEVVNEYTTLGVVHTHFLVLGVALVLVIGLVTDNLGKHGDRLLKIGFVTYASGVLATGLAMLARRVLDVLVKADIGYAVSSGANGALSGISGLCHAALGVGIVLIFVAWLLKDKAAKKDNSSETVDKSE